MATAPGMPLLQWHIKSTTKAQQGLYEYDAVSRLRDSLKLLLAEDIPPEALKSGDRKKIIPPLHGTLLKNEQDVHLFERLVFLSRTGQ